MNTDCKLFSECANILLLFWKINCNKCKLMCLLNILLTLGWDLMFTTSMLNPKQIIIIFQIYISLTSPPHPSHGRRGSENCGYTWYPHKNPRSISSPRSTIFDFFLCTNPPPNPLWCTLCVGGGSTLWVYRTMGLRSSQKPNVFIKSKSRENKFPPTDQLTEWPIQAGSCS